MKFVLVGRSILIAVEVLLSVRAFSKGACLLLGDEETQPLGRSRLCEKHLLIDLRGGDENFVRVVNAISEREPHSILIAFDCSGSRIVNRVRDRLQMKIAPIPDSSTLEMFDDKWRFQEFCHANSLPTPQTIFIGAKRNLDFDDISARLGLPFVLKPTGASGSLGVKIVTSRAYFESNIKNNPAYDHGPLIAQKYIDGTDIGFNLLAFDGRLTAFAVQQRRGPYMTFLNASKLEELAEKICRISKYHGPMNVDARIDNLTGAVFLLESNPRFWANTAASVRCGLNFVAKSVEGCPPLKTAVQRLSSGRCTMRHPLFVPSQWWRIAFDPGPRGRIKRALVFDFYQLGTVMQALPQQAKRFNQRYVRPRFENLQANRRQGDHLQL